MKPESNITPIAVLSGLIMGFIAGYAYSYHTRPRNEVVCYQSALVLIDVIKEHGIYIPEYAAQSAASAIVEYCEKDFKKQ